MTSRKAERAMATVYAPIVAEWLFPDDPARFTDDLAAALAKGARPEARRLLGELTGCALALEAVG